jgi:hypothetical protein
VTPRRLAVVTIAGTAIELAVDRHWGGIVRLIPWVALAALVVGLVVVDRWHRVACGVAFAVALSGLFGIWEHVHENYETAPLDFRYSTRWASMSEVSRWWAAINGSVGPAPLLAPGILVLAAAMVWWTASERSTRQGALSPAR